MTELTVELYGVNLGTLIGERGEFSFVTSHEALDAFGLGSTVMSIAVRKSRAQERNFFEELLSEGNVRSQLTARREREARRVEHARFACAVWPRCRRRTPGLGRILAG